MHPEGRHTKTVICLESGRDLFDRLSRILTEETDHHLSHWLKIPEDILDLCQWPAPALLIVSGALAKELLAEKLSTLVSFENLRILVVTESVNDSIYESFLQKGCHGVLERNSSDRMLLKSIEAVFAGELWVPRGVLSRIVQASVRKNLPKLTSREAEILQLITHGFKNQQIADRLFISRETVRWHIRGLYSKIGISHRPGTPQ